MLDRYLEELTKQADDRKAMTKTARRMSFAELAKMAGIKLAADLCPACGNHMEKHASMYRCGCGMMKSAAAKCGGDLPQEELDNRLKKVTGETQASELELPAYKGSLGPKTKTLGEKTAAFKKRDMPPFLKQDRPAKVKKIYKALKRDHPEYPAGKKARIASAKGKTANNVNDQEPAVGLEAQKTASVGGLIAGGKGLVRGIMGQSAKGLTKGMAKPMAGTARNMMAKGTAARQWMGKNPLATAGIGVGTGVVGTKALGGGGNNQSVKIGSAELEDIGKRAGRLLAKSAWVNPSKAFDNTPVSTDELEESIQEAQDREDIASRAKRWGVGGAVGGGLLGAGVGGALGFGGSKLMRPLFPKVPAALPTTLGAILGGMSGGDVGYHQGKAHGAEEAAADKAVSLLRALRAHQAGAQLGYGAGLHQGSAAGGFDQEKAGDFDKE